jgi:hypothetical protein
MYQLINNRFTNIPEFVLKDDKFIPLMLDNTDYQAYLAWLAEGNEPLPADEIIQQ